MQDNTENFFFHKYPKKNAISLMMPLQYPTIQGHQKFTYLPKTLDIILVVLYVQSSKHSTQKPQ